MDFKFSKEPKEGETQAKENEKGRQTGLVVLLLVMLGGFGYLYFFTGLIRPQESPPPPQPPPQVVKKTLPPRGPAVAETAKPDDPKGQTVTTEKPQIAATAVPAVKSPQKSVEVKTQPVPAAKTAKKKPSQSRPEAPSAAVKNTVSPAKPVAPAIKEEPKKVASSNSKDNKPVQADSKTAIPAVKQPVVIKKSGPWTVLVGLYVIEETLAADMVKVKKIGLNPVMTSGPRRSVTMNRLFYNEYTNRDQAIQAVDMLKSKAGVGFTVQRGGKHEVYAGSYAVQSGAISEQQRLASSGIKVTIKKIAVPLTSRKLTAGTFTDRKTAEDAVKKLRSAGIGTPAIE